MVKKITVGLLVLLLLTVLAVFKSQIFVTKKQTFQLDNTPCLSGKDFSSNISLLGQNIFTLNQSEVSQKLKNKFPCVLEVRIDRKFPNTVSVIVSGRKAVATLNFIPINLADDTEATPSSGSAFLTQAESIDGASVSAKFLIDEQGFLYSTSSESAVIQINYLTTGVKLGDSLGKDMTSNILATFQRLKELSISINKIPVLRANYLLITSDFPKKLLFALDQDINKQLASLQLILEASKINSLPETKNSKMIDTIDLRFSKPIITYTHG